jgi:branched-chain amino acid transport system permease protein
MNYILHILIMIEIYIILALSLNLLIGYTGLFSLAHAAFYGIGAYISTLLMTKLGINFFVTLPIAILGTMVLAFIIALPSLRLRGDYFLLATIGFQICIFSILYNWVSLTRGPYGIPGIPSPELFGIKITEVWQYFILGLFFSILIIYFAKKLYFSSFGRTLKSIREDEIAAIALGKNTTKFKILTFIISGAIAALAGPLFATYVSYIDPTSFTLDESIFVVTILIIGGSGNLKGPIIGVVLLLIIPEILRFLRIPDTIAPNIRQMIYGLLLIITIRLRPQGILGEYKFE